MASTMRMNSVGDVDERGTAIAPGLALLLRRRSWGSVAIVSIVAPSRLWSDGGQMSSARNAVFSARFRGRQA